MSKEAMKLALDALELNRRTHYYCEDTWYSCPKHEDGCANEAEGDECNCGADQINAQIDKAVTALRQALANEALDKKAENARELGLDYEPAQQEPVALLRVLEFKFASVSAYPAAKMLPLGTYDLYTSPPAQRTWVGLTDADKQEAFDETQEASGGFWEFADYLEAKLKEKNT